MNDENRNEETPAEDQQGGSEETSGERPTEEARTEPLPAGPRRLLRSRDDRMLAGVAGGLGSYFGVDPVIFRIGFAVSVFFGGLGALAYLALALFVPSADAEGGDETPAPVKRSGWLGIVAGAVLIVIALSSVGSLLFWGDGWGFGGGWGFGWIFLPVLIGVGLYVLLRDGGRDRPLGAGRTLALIAAVIAALIGLAVLALVSAYAGAAGGGVVVAAIVVAIGAMLVVAAFRGGARWLIVPALALSVPLGVVAAADVSFGSGIGEREYRPASFASIPDDGYELGVGRLAVDLRDLDWREDTVLDLDVDLGVGQIVVAVPETVCVVADVHAGAGEIDVTGDDVGGFDVDSVNEGTLAATPRLNLVGEIDLGAVRVVNDDDYDIDEHDFRDHDDDDEDDDVLRAAAERACAA